MKTHSFERQTILILVNKLTHSRDVTMLLNELLLRYGCTNKYIGRAVCLLFLAP